MRLNTRCCRPAAALALLLAVFVAGIQAQDQSATDLERIKEGVEAPDFTLSDSQGQAVALNHFRGKANIVLVFFRGHW